MKKEFKEYLERSGLKQLTEIIIYWIVIGILISGAIYLYWGYQIQRNSTEDGKGVYFSSSNTEITDSIIKPVNEVYADKMKQSLFNGFAIAFPLAIVYQGMRSNKSSDNDGDIIQELRRRKREGK